LEHQVQSALGAGPARETLEGVATVGATGSAGLQEAPQGVRICIGQAHGPEYARRGARLRSGIMDRPLIDRYAAGGAEPAGAIRGLSAADLDAIPVPGTWSIRQIVVHLLDSDLAATHRMKRIAAEELPLLIAYDETALAGQGFYAALDVNRCCELFALHRAHTAEFLRALPDAAFERRGVHNQSGIVTLGGLVETYVWHLEHHLGFLRRKRAMLGKELGA